MLKNTLKSWSENDLFEHGIRIFSSKEKIDRFNCIKMKNFSMVKDSKTKHNKKLKNKMEGNKPCG